MKRNLEILKRAVLPFLGACLFLGLTAFAIKLSQNQAYAINTISLTNDIAIKLPFTLTRGWDIIAIFIYIILFWILPSKKDKNGEAMEIIISLPIGASAGLFIGILLSLLINSLLGTLIACLIACGLITAIFSFLGEISFGIGILAGYSLVTGIVIGIFNLTTVGLSIGLIISLILFFIISFIILIIKLLSPKTMVT